MRCGTMNDGAAQASGRRPRHLCRMYPVVAVSARNALHPVPVERWVYPGRHEEATVRLGHQPGGIGCPHALADDHSLPLDEQFLGPHEVDQHVLGQREQPVQDRERKQLVRVYEDAIPPTRPDQPAVSNAERTASAACRRRSRSPESASTSPTLIRPLARCVRPRRAG